ncbi:MAG: hypothetical protein GXY48_01080 [Methanomicrobiales archaeon]|nr:hypothetical protein [Methanomicrobiales archaeon]
MMTKYIFRAGFLVCIIFFSFIVPGCGDITGQLNEVIILTEHDTTSQQYDDLTSVTNITESLLYNGAEEITTGFNLLQFDAEPGAIFSPDPIQNPEILFITEGTALIDADDKKVTAGEHDAVYLPENTTRVIKNIDNKTLSFFSIIQSGTIGNIPPLQNQNNLTKEIDSVQTITMNSEKTVNPLYFGDKNSNTSYEFYRLFHPSEKPYNMSFDLGTASLSHGYTIPDHYIDDSFQLFHFLSGFGSITVGCTKHDVKNGDIVYVAPGALMNITADSPVHMMVLTYPFYLPENEHQMSGACDTRIT